MVIAIDFDGTITTDNPFPIMGELRHHCKEAINYISKYNEVVLWTCRTGEYLNEAKDFLHANGIDISIPAEIRSKLKADIYIDDRNFPFREIDWFEIEDYFKNHEYKKKEV